MFECEASRRICKSVTREREEASRKRAKKINKERFKMSKQKKQAKPDRPTLEEYSEYDDPRKRREIRSMYRDLINATQKNKEDLVKPQSTGLTEVLKNAEEIFDNVRHTREAVLDSSLLLSVTNLGSEQAKQLQTDFVTFDADEFADKLVEFMSPKRLQSLQQGNEEEDEETRRRKLDSLDWKKLGKKCAEYFRRAPTVDFMLGPLVIEVPQGKVKKGRAKQEKMDASQKQAPEELSKVEEQEEATTKEVERIYGILRRLTNDGNTPVGFFEFITDPTSFGKTIENLFHLSFLVKDGKAGIAIDEDGQPTVCKTNPYREQDHQDIVMHKQIVMPMAMADWREIVEVYGIKEPLIPTRKS